jgi:hypothetical protein
MKAIVLTCDKYHPFANHMISAYKELWPNNPFTFIVPYQKNISLSKLGKKVILKKSPVEIKETVMELLKGIDDNEWIYWCIDDRYPIVLQTKKFEKIVKQLPKLGNEVRGVLLHRYRGLLLKSAVNKKEKFNIGDIHFFKKVEYGGVWSHQFIRAGFIREFFGEMPDKMAFAKIMDDYVVGRKLSNDANLYVSKKNCAIYGESTSRGKITKNCQESFLEKNLDVPTGFELSNKIHLIGSLVGSDLQDDQWPTKGIKNKVKKFLYQDS